MNELKWIIGAVVVIAISSMYFSWLDSHDRAVDKAGQDYTQCVKNEYSMTPQAYVAEYGFFPTCS
jgi:hypothetical protein